MEEYFSQMMNQFSILSIFGAFFIGTLTSLAPCSITTIPLLVGVAANVNFETDQNCRSKFIKTFTLIFSLGVILSIAVIFLLMSQFKIFMGSFPIFGYPVAGFVCLYIGLVGLGFLSGPSNTNLINYFLRFKLIGALIIGVLVGIVSSPCASPAIASILLLSQKQSFFYAFLLVMAFAFGHCIIMIMAGFSLSFVEKVGKSKLLSKATFFLQKGFAIFLMIIGIYFFYKLINLVVL